MIRVLHSRAAYGPLHSWGNGWAKAGMHGLYGGFQQAANGGSFRSGFIAAGFSNLMSWAGVYEGLGDGTSFASRLQNAFAAGVVGGTASAASGGSFGNGAVTAAFARMFNELSQAESVQESARAIWKRIDSFISSHPGDVVPLPASDLKILMMEDLVVLREIQSINGSYENLSYERFLYILSDADSLFIGYSGTSFNIYGDFPLQGTYLAEDINYYYQGFINAAAGRSSYMMGMYIDAWNYKQAITRPSFHDLRQIFPARRWAGVGYDFYRSNAVD